MLQNRAIMIPSNPCRMFWRSWILILCGAATVELEGAADASAVPVDGAVVGACVVGAAGTASELGLGCVALADDVVVVVEACDIEADGLWVVVDWSSAVVLRELGEEWTREPLKTVAPQGKTLAVQWHQ